MNRTHSPDRENNMKSVSVLEYNRLVESEKSYKAQVQELTTRYNCSTVVLNYVEHKCPSTSTLYKLYLIRDWGYWAMGKNICSSYAYPQFILCSKNCQNRNRYNHSLFHYKSKYWITLNFEILHAYIQVVTFYMYMFNSNKHNFLNIRTED